MKTTNDLMREYYSSELGIHSVLIDSGDFKFKEMPEHPDEHDWLSMGDTKYCGYCHKTMPPEGRKMIEIGGDYPTCYMDPDYTCKLAPVHWIPDKAGDTWVIATPETLVARGLPADWKP